MTARRHTRQAKHQKRRAANAYLTKKNKEARDAVNQRGGDTSILHRHKYDLPEDRSKNDHQRN